MSSIIRVTKEFSFEMAHALRNYDGPCKNVHGHSYKLFVTLAGKPVDDPENPKNGMVIDFNDLKRIVREQVIAIFDHSVAISRDYGKSRLNNIREMFDNIIVLDYQPTCENLAADFAVRINQKLPPEVKLHNLRLFETATSYAEWFASDNE